jgi:hypothetical protein
MSRLLWSMGVVLVALGLAAQVFGWDTLLWLPVATVEVARSNPETYGLVAVGVALIVVARLLGRRSR